MEVDNISQIEIDLDDETINIENVPKDVQNEILWIHKYFSDTGLRKIVFDLKTKEKFFFWKEGARELNDPRLVKYWEKWRMMLLKNEKNIGKGAVFSEKKLDVYKNFDEAGRAMWKRRSEGESVICTCIGKESRLDNRDLLMMDEADETFHKFAFRVKKAIKELTVDRPESIALCV